METIYCCFFAWGCTLEDELNNISSDNIVRDDYQLFKDKIIKAEYILYIGDNAEEAVFDKLLIELVYPKKIIFAQEINLF